MDNPLPLAAVVAATYIAIHGVIFVVRGIIALYGSRRSVGRALRRLAERRGGLALRTGLLRPPRVVFTHDGAEVNVEVTRSDDRWRRRCTRLTVGWPDPAAACRIEPHTLATRMHKLFGVFPRNNLLPQFDRRFVAQLAPGDEADDLLTAGLQNSILNLQRQLSRSDVQVLIEGQKFTVQARRVIRDGGVLERFTALALEVYDQALAGRSAGIEVVAHRLDAAAGGAHCPVCGESIAGDLVYCRSCSTPHHRECWRYVGGCSTFACGETHYSAPAGKFNSRLNGWRPAQPR